MILCTLKYVESRSHVQFSYWKKTKQHKKIFGGNGYV